MKQGSKCPGLDDHSDTIKAVEESATEVAMKKEVTDTQQPVSEYPGNDDPIGIIIHVICIVQTLVPTIMYV